MNTRYQSLDLLRAVAILLVLCRHLKAYPGTNAWVDGASSFFRTGGWAGVDLFFVLSGFLIGGLLFKEHRKYGRISFKHFFIRRGFKIYPAYYLLVLPTGLAGLLFFSRPDSLSSLFAYIFFLQDYFISGGVFLIAGHLWSLGVEEQFYLLLPVLLLWLEKKHPGESNPFKAIPYICLAVAVFCLAARVATVGFGAHPPPFHMGANLTPLHLRLDSLFFGVAIAYLYHFRRWRFRQIALRLRPFLLIGGTLLFCPAFFYEIIHHPFIYTVGYTLLFLGSGFILIAVCEDEPRTDPLTRALAYIGTHSYCIYLFHLPIAWLVYGTLDQQAGQPASWFWSTLIFFCGSIGAGILISNLLEFPMLRLRDRLFPSRSGSAVG